jgi:hypothetical protein
MTLSIMEQCYYADCHLSLVSIVLSVANKPIMLSVIMLSVYMLSVVAPFAGQHGDINFLNQAAKFPKSL